MTLLEAAKKGAEWMRWWISQGGCECENGHSCGLTERRNELALIERAIKIEEAGMHVPSVPQICSLCGHKGTDVLRPVFKISYDGGPVCHKCDREEE